MLLISIRVTVASRRFGPGSNAWLPDQWHHFQDRRRRAPFGFRKIRFQNLEKRAGERNRLSERWSILRCSGQPASVRKYLFVGKRKKPSFWATAPISRRLPNPA